MAKRTVSRSTGRTPKSKGTPPRIPPPPPRILIVEDDYLVAIELEAALTDAGFAVAGIAASAGEAATVARVTRPALAIVDIHLAGHSDGVAAALAMKAAGIRSLFATAHDDAETRRRAAPARPLGWIAKPYRSETVVAAVRHALEGL
jgi:DNA-binding NarL/FixJ family response regulator